MIEESGFLCKLDKTSHYYFTRIKRLCRAAIWPLFKRTLDRPVFIVGCSRAGTTLVYKIFSEADELGSLQYETHDIWAGLHPMPERNWSSHALDINDAGAFDRQYMARYFFIHTGSLRVVDKNNQNGLCVSYLNALYPDAIFVYVKRSPGDNLNSLIEGWGKPEEFATWSNRLPVNISISGGRYRRWCFFLPPGWRDYINAEIEEVCAYQYSSMNQMIMDARESIPSARWIEIQYEDLLRYPEKTVSQAFSRAALEFTGEYRQRLNTVLSIPHNAFSEIRLDKWKEGPHRSKIEAVLPSLCSVAARMGYRV
jgi:hypothetical protein